MVMAKNHAINGSGRSVAGFNMIEAMQEMPEFFLKFGGHPMACGFTLKDPALLEAFKAALISKSYGKDINESLFKERENEKRENGFEKHLNAVHGDVVVFLVKTTRDNKTGPECKASVRKAK